MPVESARSAQNGSRAEGQAKLGEKSQRCAITHKDIHAQTEVPSSSWDRWRVSLKQIQGVCHLNPRLSKRTFLSAVFVPPSFVILQLQTFNSNQSPNRERKEKEKEGKERKEKERKEKKKKKTRRHKIAVTELDPSIWLSQAGGRARSKHVTVRIQDTRRVGVMSTTGSFLNGVARLLQVQDLVQRQF